MLSTHSAPAKCGWQRNWIHRGALRPANPVTCFPPGKVVAPATKGGECISDARRAVVWFSHGRKPGCKGFIQTGAFYNLEAPYNNPRAKGASNLSPLRTFGPAGRQPSSPSGLVHSVHKKSTTPKGSAFSFYFSFSSSVGAGSFWTKSRVPWISWSFTSSASAAVQYVPSLLVRAA